MSSELCVYVVRFLDAVGREPVPRRIMLEESGEWVESFNRFRRATGVVASRHRIDLAGLDSDFDGQWE